MAGNEPTVQPSETFTVVVSEDRKNAFITLAGPINGKDFTEEQIIDALKKAGVVHGIDQKMIRILSQGGRYGTQEHVASATLPVEGNSARINYHFPITSEAKPKELENGSVDFKDLGLIKNVFTGEVLCSKTPLTEGAPGTDVMGGVMPSKPGKDFPLPIGQNTMLSEDELSIIAKVDGQVDLVQGKVSVMSVFVIEENVDYNTGNIDFVGNVEIRGDVIAGFTVKAGGNVHIKGSVDGGVVEAEGNITVVNGVNGQAHGKIVCGGNLRCKHLQSATVYVSQNLETTSCVNSTVHVGGDALFMGNKAMILSSRVSAGHMVEAFNIGSRSSSAGNVIEVGINPQIAERARQIPNEIIQIQKNLESMDRLVMLYKQLEKANRLDEDKKADQAKITATVQNEKVRMQMLEQEKEDLLETMKQLGNGVIRVYGTAFNGTQIVIGTEKMNLTSDYQFTTFAKKPGGISTMAAR